jgi:uncharacterized protein
MHLTLHLTARCNLRCSYCYDSDHQGGNMSLDTVMSAMAMSQQSSPANGSIGIVFYGGEPLLRRELIAETVRLCRAIKARTGQQFHFKMTTNGILLDEVFLTHPDTGKVQIALSHDGVRDAHDAHRVDRAAQGTFDRLSPKVDLLLAHRPDSLAMAVVTPATVSYYAESVAYLFQRGFRYMHCSLDYGARWTQAHLAELRREYRKLARWYWQATTRQEQFYFSPLDTKIASHVNPGSCFAERCDLGRHQVSVAPNGRLYPCVQFVGDGTDDTYAIGDVATGIDPSPLERIANQASMEGESCADCAIRARCDHYCGCLNKQATGRVDQVSPVLCAHERIVLPIADRLAERLFRRSPAFVSKHYQDPRWGVHAR